MTIFDGRAALDELHHRMDNTLQIVSGLLAREARAAGGQAAQILLKAEAQVQAFALLNRALRISAAEGCDERPCAGAYLSALCLHLEAACLSPAGIALEMMLEKPLPLDPPACRTLGLIATELVLNAAKHAFAGREDGIVGVILTRLPEPPRVVLGVMDNGCGLDDHSAAGSRQGLGFVRLLADSLNGECAVTSGPGGTRVAITAPLTS